MTAPLPAAISRVTILLLAFLSSQAGMAQIPQSGPLHGDAANGKRAIATCLGCHGNSGYHNAYPHFRIPRIGGQSEAYLLRAMIDYRDGKRINPTMQAQMHDETDQQLADIAAYLAHGD